MSSKRPTGDPLAFLIEQTRRRVLRLEQKLIGQQPAGQFSLVTASKAEGPLTLGFGSFVSTPWSPHVDTVTVIGLWAGVGTPDGFTATKVELVKNGTTETSLSISPGLFSAQSACGVMFTPSDTLTFSAPDNSALWDLLTVYAVVSSPGQSAGLDFLYSTRPL